MLLSALRFYVTVTKAAGEVGPTLGVELSVDTVRCTNSIIVGKVLEPTQGLPVLSHAGVRAGDSLQSVNGNDLTRDFDLEDVIRMMRKTEGELRLGFSRFVDQDAPPVGQQQREGAGGEEKEMTTAAEEKGGGSGGDDGNNDDDDEKEEQLVCTPTGTSAITSRRRSSEGSRRRLADLVAAITTVVDVQDFTGRGSGEKPTKTVDLGDASSTMHQLVT